MLASVAQAVANPRDPFAPIWGKLVDSAKVGKANWEETIRVLDNLPSDAEWQRFSPEEKESFQTVIRMKNILDRAREIRNEATDRISDLVWSEKELPNLSEKISDVRSELRSIPSSKPAPRPDAHLLLHMLRDGLDMGAPAQLYGMHGSALEHDNVHASGYQPLINREAADAVGAPAADVTAMSGAIGAMAADPTVHNWVHAQEAHGKAFGVLQAQIDAHHAFHHAFSDPHTYLHALMDQVHNEWHTANPGGSETAHAAYHATPGTSTLMAPSA